MAIRTILIERRETKHSVAEIYATVFDNGLVDIRRKVRNKLTGNEHDTPENRLQLTLLKQLIEDTERE